jgi:hypothetical protein
MNDLQADPPPGPHIRRLPGRDSVSIAIDVTNATFSWE